MQAHTTEHKKESKEVKETKQHPATSTVCFAEQIYNAAKNPNKNEAKIAINKILSFASINVLSKSGQTAIHSLAMEGNSEAVNFLRKEFNASMLSMAGGYARGGYVAEVNKLVALVKTRDTLLELLDYVVSGYARGGYVEEVNKLLLLAKTAKEQFRIWEGMITGYAVGGHTTEAEKVLALAKTSDEQFNLYQSLIAGYSRGGHIAKTNEVFERFRTENNYRHMAFGYALSKSITEVNKVLAFGKSPQDKMRLIKKILHGYAIGGHADEVDKVLMLAQTPEERVILLQWIINGYAHGGHVMDANKVLASTQDPATRLLLMSEMISGYASKNILAEINKVLALAPTRIDRLGLSKSMIKMLNKIELSGEQALRTLATFDPAFQMDIAKELKDSKEIEVDVTSLVPKASKINTVMATQKLNFSQALGWIQPEMQIWLLQGPQLIKNKRLPAAIFLKISTYLSPNTHKDMIDLANKFMLTTCRDRFFQSLTTHDQLLSYQLIAEPTDKATEAKKN